MKFHRKFIYGSVFLTLAGVAVAAGIEIRRDVPSTYVYPASGFLPFNIHRGTQTMMTLMMPGAFFANPQGVACALLKADHHANDPNNDVVVTIIGVNSDAGEIVYNVGLRALKRFGSTGTGNGEFLNPMGAAIDPDGDVAVADTGNNRIVLLKHDSLRLSWVKAVGKKGKGTGQFAAPLAVAYDSQDNLYIADTGNDRIQVRDPRGHFKVLNIADLDSPSALAIIDGKEPWTFYTQGRYADRLAVIDRAGTRLRTFTLDGQPLAKITTDQLSDPPAKLYGCAFDFYGNVVVTDIAKSCLRKFDKDLRYVVTFGGEGTDDFQFTEPRGIAISHQFGQVLVAEKKSVQYFWNGADAVDLKTGQQGSKVRISSLLTERAFVTAEIQDAQGTVLKKLVGNQDMEQGFQELVWAPDQAVAPGNYQFVLRVMATYSSRELIAKEITEPILLTK